LMRFIHQPYEATIVGMCLNHRIIDRMYSTSQTTGIMPRTDDPRFTIGLSFGSSLGGAIADRLKWFSRDV
jgi:hypothetical protein